MKFLDILKGIVHGLGTAIRIAEPIVEVASEIPSPIQPIATTVFEAMKWAEGFLPAKGQGSVRKEIVSKAVLANHPTTDAAQLSAWIDEIVATGNAFAAALAKVK